MYGSRCQVLGTSGLTVYAIQRLVLYKCDGLGLLHQAVGVLQHTELIQRTSH